ncbi:MAG TPA: 30S ribosomal protein S20 [Chloroflexi bacterium]|nr:30S ribosomal protein S20 [Chloroflexota bacterium]
MPNTKSAKKQARQNRKRWLRNRLHLGRARSAVKKARRALASGDVEEAREAVRLAAKWLDHAASKGSLHKRNAARRKARLMQQLAALEKQS